MSETKSPNLLIIHTDQQSYWTLSCYGGKTIETPHIDSLANNGVLFKNFFTNSAVCTPSRGCFVTGRYPTSHGAYVNNLPLNRDEVTFAEILKRKGYKTGYSGKWHLDGDRRPGWLHPHRAMGFDDVQYMFNRGHWKKISDSNFNKKDDPLVFPYSEIGDEETYTTDWLTEKTLNFIDKNQDLPFCYMVSIPDPHSPVQVREPYNSMVNPDDVELPIDFYPENLPDWALESHKNSRFGLESENREEVCRKFLAQYFGEVKLIDDCVGKMVAKLKNNGLYENTVIVFTTDHGEYGGEHGMQHKNNLYETAYKIPMIMHWPEGLQKPLVLENILSTVDFQPTLLSLMGFEASGREEGRDGSALLKGEKVQWDEYAYLHHASHNIAGIFTDKYELGLVKGRDCILFDRVNDPDQVNNLYKDESYSEVIKELKDKIFQHHQSLNTPSVEWLS
jgi:arylsulfatase A-like enzyme